MDLDGNLDEYAGCRWQSIAVWPQHILVWAVEWAEKDTQHEHLARAVP